MEFTRLDVQIAFCVDFGLFAQHLSTQFDHLPLIGGNFALFWPYWSISSNGNAKWRSGRETDGRNNSRNDNRKEPVAAATTPHHQQQQQQWQWLAQAWIYPSFG
uniref:Uncharacterized protein n=1 Tax=Globodera rostochiensis TaxID=31243 RepID=A0A914HRX6_GLORO